MDGHSPSAEAMSALLIVDDTPLDLHALSELLKKQGHEVRYAYGGELTSQSAAGTPVNAELEKRIRQRTAELEQANQSLSEIKAQFEAGSSLK